MALFGVFCQVGPFFLELDAFSGLLDCGFAKNITANDQVVSLSSGLRYDV